MDSCYYPSTIASPDFKPTFIHLIMTKLLLLVFLRRWFFGIFQKISIPPILLTPPKQKKIAVEEDGSGNWGITF